MTDIRAVLQAEVDRLRAQLAEYAPVLEQLKRAERALRELTGQKQSRLYTRVSNVNAPGKATDMILGWIRPGDVVDAKQVASALHVSTNRAVVALNRLARTGRLEKVERGRFRMKEAV